MKRDPLVDPEAERAVLGSILAGHEVEVPPEDGDMAVPENALVLSAMLAVRARGDEVNHLSVSEVLRRRADGAGISHLEKVGGPAALMRLDEESLHGRLGIQQQARRLRDLAVRRRALKTLHGIAEDLRNTERPASEAVLGGAGDLAKLAGGGLAQWKTLTEAIHEQLDQAEKIQRGDQSAVRFLPTGIEAIDRAQAGLPLEVLTLIAAHPNVGKTALLNTLALSLAGQGSKVALFVLEDNRGAPARRAIASATGMEVRKIFRPGLSEDELQRLWEKPADLSAATDNVLVDDEHHQSVYQVAAKIRQAVAMYGIRAALVDHLLEMLDFEEAANARDLAVGTILKVLRDVADDCKIAVVIAVHLKDPQEPRIDARFVRPKMQDLVGGRFTDRMARAIWALWKSPPPREPPPMKEIPEPKTPQPKARPGATLPGLDDRREQEEAREEAMEAWRQKKAAAATEHSRKVREWEEKCERARDTIICTVLKSLEGGPAGQEFELRQVRHAGLVATKEESSV